MPDWTGVAYLICLIHLVELIDAADAVVGKHEGTSLHTELARLRVLHHTARHDTGTKSGLRRLIEFDAEKFGSVRDTKGQK